MNREQNIIDTEAYLEKMLSFYKNKMDQEKDPFFKIWIGSKVELINDIKDQIDFIKRINLKKEEIQESLKALEYDNR